MKNEKNDINFLNTIKILEDNKINYWICHGTLLGIVRDNQLIEWDHDIDIAIWSDQIPKNTIIQLFEKDNFKLREGFGVERDIISFERDGGRIVDINFYEKIFREGKYYAYVKWYLPKNYFMKIIDALSNGLNYNGKYKKIFHLLSFMQNFFIFFKKKLIKYNLFYREAGYSEPLEFIEEIHYMNFFKNKIKIPKYPESYLEYIYGKDWKIPKKNYIWYRDSKSVI